MRLVPITAAVAALVALAIAAYLFVAETLPNQARGPQILVPNTVYRLNEISLGDCQVSVTVQNLSNSPRTIVGLNEGCANNCCFKPKHPGPVTIAPRETIEYPVVLLLTRSGSFEARLELYVNDGGVRAIELTITGTVKGVE